MICCCEKCELSQYRHNAVPGEGSENAEIMIIGERPGEENDKTGRPFVGRGGKILDKYLIDAEVKREKIFLTNIIKCRMPYNATPNNAIISSCSGYLMQQVDIVQPKVIITLGLPAAKLMLNKKNIKLFNACHEVFQCETYKMLCTYHPSSIRYNKEAGTCISFALQKANEIVKDDKMG